LQDHGYPADAIDQLAMKLRADDNALILTWFGAVFDR